LYLPFEDDFVTHNITEVLEHLVLMYSNKPLNLPSNKDSINLRNITIPTAFPGTTKPRQQMPHIGFSHKELKQC
jgi:hypothetical protein